jgi:ribosomal protein L37AE/L43A
VEIVVRDSNDDLIPPDVVAPTACPFCASTEIGTRSKAVTPSTYWSCGTCGQIWNAQRLQPPGTTGAGRWQMRYRF